MNLGARILTTRWAARLPIALFRARLGFLFGGRLLMLRHRGRTSGEWRTVALETVRRDSADVVVVASGFGTGAQWYRNLRADPRCRVSIGWWVDRPARAELLDPVESRTVLDRYAAEHPRLWAALRRTVQGATGQEDPQIPMVRLLLDGGERDGRISRAGVSPSAPD